LEYRSAEQLVEAGNFGHDVEEPRCDEQFSRTHRMTSRQLDVESDLFTPRRDDFDRREDYAGVLQCLASRDVAEARG
jgi:hypothetical protein